MDEGQEAEDDLVFDPRILLTPPIIDCPKCGGKKSFGVDRVSGNRCTKRCVDCQYGERIDLPQLKKKIIYIDQFAVSEMAKAELTQKAETSAPNADIFWRKLYDVLIGLCRLQVIVCPSSELHTQESEVDSRHLDFGLVYRRLSGDVHFQPFLHIRQQQFRQLVKQWVQGTFREPLALCPEEATGRALHDWWNPGRLIMQFTNWPKVGTESRAAREEVASGITSEFTELLGSDGFDFWERFRAEVKTSADEIIRGCNKRTEARALFAKGVPPANINDLLPSSATMMAEGISHGLSEAGVADADVPRLIGDYLVSEAIEYVPFVRISAMLCAAHARKFAGGRRKPITPSGIADIQMIATLLPYCDAMFLDRECCALLSEEPLASQSGYPCKVFSTKTREGFLSFLRELGKGVCPEHIALARSVYGPGIDNIVALFQ